MAFQFKAYLEDAALATIAVFAPIHAAIITIMGLIAVDLVTGIMASLKRGDKITSQGIKRTVGKIFLYEIALCMGFLVQQYLTGDFFPASKLISALIGITELKSILENLDTISGSSFYQVILNRATQTQEKMENKKDDATK